MVDLIPVVLVPTRNDEGHTEGAQTAELGILLLIVTNLLNQHFNRHVFLVFVQISGDRFSMLIILFYDKKERGKGQ